MGSGKEEPDLAQGLVNLLQPDVPLVHEIAVKLMRLQLVVADFVHLRLYLAHILVLLPHHSVALHHKAQLERRIVDVDQQRCAYCQLMLRLDWVVAVFGQEIVELVLVASQAVAFYGKQLVLELLWTFEETQLFLEFSHQFLPISGQDAQKLFDHTLLV